MPDVTLVDISEGVRDSYAAAGATVTNAIATSNVYFGRQPEDATLPYCVYEFKDVSAYFGGTEYFSGTKYVKVTQVTFKVYCPTTFDIGTYSTALNNALSWSATNPAGAWTIPNATVLSAMPEVEDMELEEERIDGQDVLRYETTFSVRMEADRG